MRTTNIALPLLLGTTALRCTPFLSSLDDTFGTHGEDGTDGGTPGYPRGPRLPPVASFSRYLKAQPTMGGSQFGISVAAFGESVAVNAPFENVSDSDGAKSITRGGATYFYPNKTEEPVRLVAPNVDVDDGWVRGDVEPSDWQARVPDGWGSTALALNEKYLIVGVAGEDSGNPADPGDNSVQDSGAVYVYKRDLGAKPQYLKPPFPTPNEWFGRAVALSGKWLFVGAPLEASGTADDASDTSAPAAGAVFVYQDTGNGFEPAGYVKAPHIQEGDEFGRSIAADSNVLVVGSPTEDSASTGVGGDPSDDSFVGSGAAWVYRYDGAKWNPEEYLKPGSPPILPSEDAGATENYFFGVSVALSSDRIAVGAPNATACDPNQPGIPGRGAVYVFWRTGGRWTYTGCLSPHGPNRDAFGWALDMTPAQLLVGAVWDSEKRDPQPIQNTFFSGAAYLFDPVASGNWVERQFIKGPNTISSDLFGHSVALTSSGFVAGAPWQTSTSMDVTATVVVDADKSGAAYVYTLEDADAAAP